MRRLVITIIASVIALGGIHSRAAYADPADAALTDAQLQAISRSCIAAQGQIQRVQVSDKVARTNRGSSYAALIRLMQALNQRTADNNFDTTTLTLTAAAAEAKYQQFISDYTKYDNTMDEVVRMSCQSQPAVFYAALTQTRGLRVQLANDVRGLDEIVAQYQAATADLATRVVNHNHGAAP